MSVRTKVLGFVDVMMRVPPVMVIDQILRIGMGLPTRLYPSTLNDIDATSSGKDALTEPATNNDTFAPLKAFFSGISGHVSPEVNQTQEALERAIENASAAATEGGMLSSTFNVLMDDLSRDTSLSDILSLTSVKFVICLLGFLCASCIFMLWTRHLVMVYMFVTSLGLTFLSYWSNVSALALMERSPCILGDILSLNATRLLDSGGVVMSLLPHLVAQWFMGMLFAYIHLGPRFALIQKSMPLLFTSPILIALLPLPPRFVHHLPLMACCIPIILTKITLMNSAMDASKTVYNGYQYSMNFVSNFGLSALIENEWQRLNVPSVLRVFWIIRIGQSFCRMMMADTEVPLQLLPTAQKLLVDGCETLTAVLGMTAVISVVCHYIGRAFQWYLLTFDNDEEKSLGTVSAVLFYILALQTGLTSLTPDKRFVRLCRNLCLLVTALLHFLHNIVSPILMSLSAARNPSRKRHVRALSVCAFLIVVPICLLCALWTRHSPSTWLLAVTAFSVEVVVKVLVSLATYTLFLLDARRQFFWEKLDDYLYYVRAFGNSVEFCFGILLFLNGAWILVFESGGAIRAIMMCIHAYFNIWCEARAGWSVFMKRRSAVHKISALPEATQAQLQAFDDVCAICYQEMYSAKITRCRHFFHGVCLRKWLYVQDRCPLCHEIMMYTDKSDDNDSDTPPPEGETEEALRIYPRDGDNVANSQRHRTPERLLVTNAAATSASAVGLAAADVDLYGPDAAEATTTAASNSTANASNSSSTTSSATATTATSSAAAAVATAAASNTTQIFQLAADGGMPE